MYAQGAWQELKQHLEESIVEEVAVEDPNNSGSESEEKEEVTSQSQIIKREKQEMKPA